MQDTSKPLGSKDIFEKLKDRINSACSVISSLKALRNSNFIKIVKYEENSSSVKIYYQIKSSPLEEIKVYTEDEGYTSISSFFKKLRFLFYFHKNSRLLEFLEAIMNLLF